MGQRRSSLSSGDQDWLAEYGKFEDWPPADPTRLKGKSQDRFDRLAIAMQLYLSGQPMAMVVKQAKISRQRFGVIFKRCTSVQPDGKILGARGLVLGARAKDYSRDKPASTAGNPGAGVFRKLFRDLPGLERSFEKRLETRARYKIGAPPRWFRNAHKDFLDACLEDMDGKLTLNDYPFTSGDQAFRAFKRWMKEEFIPRHLARWVMGSQGPVAAQAHQFAEGDGESKRLLGPYKSWQVDEYDIDINAKCTLPAPKNGEISAKLKRISEIRVVDVGSGAVLGRRLVVASKVSANDVLIALWDAMSGPPEVPKAYPSESTAEACYPANGISQLRFAVPEVLYLDNALVHIATAVRVAVEGVWGARIKFGSPGNPQERSAVEGDICSLANALIHQLPGTTGSRPGDAKRELAKVALTRQLDVYALDQAIDEYTRNKNLTPTAASFYSSPMHQLRRQVETQRLRPNYLRPDMRKAWYFMRTERITVRMGDGRLPFVYLLGSRYTSAQLRSSISLVNKTLWFRYDPRDLRTLLLFNDDGTEFGPVSISGQWGRWPHDLRMKRLYLRAKRIGALGPRPEDAPLAALFAYLRAGAVKDKDLATNLQYIVSHLMRHNESLDVEELNVCREWGATTSIMNSTEPIALATAVSEPILPSSTRRQDPNEFIAAPSPVLRFSNFPRSFRR